MSGRVRIRLLYWITLCLASQIGGGLVGAATDLPQALHLQPPNEAVEAPDFTLKDPGGKQIHLKDLRGKLVFLSFFATWCGPCREEMPAMEDLHQAYRDKDLSFLAIDMRESGKAVKAFLQELKISFPTVLDEDGAVGHDYGVRALPVSFLVGRDGMIMWRAIGSRDWNSPQARRYFAQLLNGKK